MKLKDAIEEVRTKPTVPLSVVGTVLDMSRGSVYQAAHSGEIDVIRIGHRIRAVTAPLRKKLGIEVLRLPTEEVKTVDTVTNPKTVKPKRWRDVLPIHPAADEFPELSETELRELADDIEAHGLRELVALYDDPEIGLCLLDGRNRADALELIGKSITDDNEENWTEHVGEDDPDFDPYAFVVSKNIKRRHLTSEKKRDVIAKLLTLNPAKSNRAIAAIAGVSHNTVVAVREEMEATGQIDQLEKTTGIDGRERPVRRQSLRDKILFDGFGDPEPVEQVEMANSEPYDPAADEATMEEMLADPVFFWRELTGDAKDRLWDACDNERLAWQTEDHAARVRALGDLIAAATEIKKFFEDHLLAGQRLQ